MIPNNWKKIKLGEVVDFTNGKAHENSIVKEGQFILVNSKFISSSGSVIKKTNEQKSPLFKNDITMVMSDVPNGRALAKCFLIDKDNKYTLNQRICGLRTKRGIDSKYIFHTLDRNNYYIRFDNGVGQTNLKKKEVLGCPILIPSLPEQKRIIEIISTWDQAIEKLDKLISAKQKQFKWLLKKFITDQKNNPKWKKVRLKEVLSLEYGKALKKSERKGGHYPVFGSNGIDGYHNEYLIKAPLIIVGRKGSAGKVNYYEQSGFPIDTTFYVKLKEPHLVSLKYLFFQLKKITLNKLSSQSAVPGINRNHVYSIKIPLPSLAEQKRITEILFKWKKRLNYLNSFLKNIKDKKKGSCKDS